MQPGRFSLFFSHVRKTVHHGLKRKSCSEDTGVAFNYKHSSTTTQPVAVPRTMSEGDWRRTSQPACLLPMSRHRLGVPSIKLIPRLESSIVQGVAAIYPKIFIVKVSIQQYLCVQGSSSGNFATGLA